MAERLPSPPVPDPSHHPTQPSSLSNPGLGLLPSSAHRSRKAGSKPEEEIPDELRCKRSDGKQWRCNARAMENKTLCEKHYNQAKKRAAGAASNASPKKKVKIKDASFVDGKVPNKPSTEGGTRSKPLKSHGSNVNLPQNSNTEHHPPKGRQHFPNGSFITRDEGGAASGFCVDAEKELQGCCHQCGNSENEDMICCTKCGKNFCSGCISRCYPEMHEEEVHQACPFCCGNCNCKVCLGVKRPESIFPEVQPVSGTDKVKFLTYALAFIQPLLQQLHEEQCQEVELDVALRGDASTKTERSKLKKDERLYCDNCHMSIVDLYRSCPTCSYDLCLTCCRELRQGQQPGGEYAGSAEQTSHQNRVKGLDKASISGSCFKIPSWTVNYDGSIPCPPRERGGCGSSTMILKRILKSNWISKLLTDVNHIMSAHQSTPVSSDVRYQCSTCTSRVSSGLASVSDSFLMQAACRKENTDNFIYSPTIQAVKDEGVDHFQEHWCRGEPIVVKNVLEEGKAPSWDPNIISNAIQEWSKSKFVKAFDCLGWHPVQINITQFFKGYRNGRLHKNGWPELLKLNDWLPASFFEEKIPGLGSEFISSLPFPEYTNTKHGILNLASKVPDDGLRTEFGPKTYITYGIEEELGRGDSVTKLHYDMADKVILITHATKIEIPDWQKRHIEKFKSLYKEAMSDVALGEHIVSKGHEMHYSMIGSKLQHVSAFDESHQDRDVCNGDNGQIVEMKRDSLSGVALWDVFRRQDVPKLQAYLQKHFHEFRHVHEEFIDHVIHPIHDQTFYLTEDHKRRLKNEFGIEAWTFQQHTGEAVLVPVGCPYQVRNLKSCIKVALEFVSPESLQECVRQTEEFRLLPKDHCAKEDRLEARKLILYAANRAVKDMKHMAPSGSNGEMSYQNVSGPEDSCKLYQKSSEDT